MDEVVKYLNEKISLSGYRNSNERSIILKFVLNQKGEFTTNDIINLMDGQRICDAAIYNTLNLFYNIDIIDVIPSIGSSKVYKLTEEVFEMINNVKEFA